MHYKWLICVLLLTILQCARGGKDEVLHLVEELDALSITSESQWTKFLNVKYIPNKDYFAEELKIEKIHVPDSTELYKKYKNPKEIGKGSFGIVFTAQNLHNETVAVKVVSKVQHNINGYILDIKENLLNEYKALRVLAECKTPYVANLIETYQDNSFIYYVLEYAKYGTFENFAHNYLETTSTKDGHKLCKEKDVRRFVVDMFFMLHAIHEAGVIHGDLHLSNIVVNKNGELQLIDFGLSRNKNYRRNGEVDGLGLYYIMPVEMFKETYHSKEGRNILGPPYGTYTEIQEYWSIPINAIYLLSGSYPFGPDPTITAEFMKFYNAPKIGKIKFDTDVQKAIKNISPRGSDFIYKMLQFEPKNRLSSKGFENVKSHPWFQKFSDNGTHFEAIDWNNWSKPFLKELNKVALDIHN